MSKFRCPVCGGTITQQRSVAVRVRVSVENVKITKSDMVRVLLEALRDPNYKMLPNDILQQKSMGMRCESCMAGFARSDDRSTWKGERIHDTDDPG